MFTKHYKRYIIIVIVHQREDFMAVGDTPAKLTKDAKAAIQIAFENLGGLDRLVDWANQPQNLGTFYTQIWSRIIPKELNAKHTGKDDGPIVITWMGAPPNLPTTVELDRGDAEDALILSSSIAMDDITEDEPDQD